MQHPNPEQRGHIATLLLHLAQSPDIVDTNDVAEMIGVYMTRRGWYHQPHRLIEMADEACNGKITRFNCSEAVENWIHYSCPEEREEVTAPPAEQY